MKLPLSLLKSFIDIDLPLSELEETLTMLGIEVDAVYAAEPSFSGVVVGLVKSCLPHESAEKLQVAQVFDGKETVPVVCAAANCRPGLRTAFAKVGARWTDEKEVSHTIERTKIRGVESAGMLCSAKELGLYDDESGILELPDEFEAGADCVPLLWDPILEISLTPNLGHCMSALGIARELSAVWNRPLRAVQTVQELGSPKTHRAAKKSDLSVHDAVQVAVKDPHLVPRYMARVIDHCKIGPSPFWLQRVLFAAGLRPVNNIVDATNYILLKMGQPLHAFDYDTIEGKKIEAAPSTKAIRFRTLTGTDLEIPAGTLLISDAKKPIAIAGVMGSLESSVTEPTQTILLEAASFDPVAIRTAAKKTGLRSDSSHRFEKGVDPASVGDALEFATALIAELSGGTPRSGAIDCSAGPSAPRTISCRPSRVNHLLGTKISSSEMQDIFRRLGFTVRGEGDPFFVDVPLYRMDIREEIDLVEEVARIYGYNHIERPLPKSTMPQLAHDPSYLFETELRRRLIALGLQEFLTCDLISPKLAEIAQELLLNKTFLHTLYAKSDEYSILRPSLLPGLLQVVKTNLDQKNHSLSAFEIGRIHLLQNNLPVEFPMAAILLTGLESPHHWDSKPSNVDFFELKGLIENLMQGFRITAEYKPSMHPTFHPGRQADLFAGETHLGTLGELHPNLLAKLDIKQKIYYAELNGLLCQKLVGTAPKFANLAQFPASERDVTIPIDPKAHISTIFDKIRAVHSPLLERFDFIDYYPSDDKVNVTFRFVYRDRSKTVSFEEVEAAHAKIVQELTH